MCTGLSAEMGASKNCVLPPCMTTRSLFWMRSMIHPSPLPGTSLSRSLAVSTPAVRIVARNVKPRGNFAVRTASHLSPALGTPDQSGFTDGFTPLAAASIVLGVSTVEYTAASRNSPFSLSPPRELTPNETGSSGFTGSPPANVGNAAAAKITTMLFIMAQPIETRHFYSTKTLMSATTGWMPFGAPFTRRRSSSARTRGVST